MTLCHAYGTNDWLDIPIDMTGEGDDLMTAVRLPVWRVECVYHSVTLSNIQLSPSNPQTYLLWLNDSMMRVAGAGRQYQLT
mmetsp:Transcript_33653/g.50194  ORF Transcript_33653/g.50194 Transcript_33653/m.50194 type:complete len:81 (-) Transcript_33653:1335-1577(-)